MGNSVKSLKKLIDECSDTNRHEWTDEARTILEAVRRTSRPTKWKVKHTIAEAILKKITVPSIADSGWKLRTTQSDNSSSGVVLERAGLFARVAIVLLQPATAKFRRIYRGQHSDSAYALEMQKKQMQTNALIVSVTSIFLPSTLTRLPVNGRTFAIHCPRGYAPIPATSRSLTSFS